MDELTVTETKLQYPTGNGAGVESVDMIEIHRLEARKSEVAMVNKTKAPELMQAFTEGFSLCAKVLPRIGYELTVAKSEMDKRAAVVHLDEAPRILKEKGLANARNPAGSADLRQAILDSDEEYAKLKDRVAQIDAAWELMKGYQKTFELSFSAVKKVFDTLSQYGQLQGGAETSITPDIGIPRY